MKELSRKSKYLNVQHSIFPNLAIENVSERPKLCQIVQIK